MKKYFYVYSNCIFVKGYNRSSICDLHKGTLQMVPNDLLTIFKKSKVLNINQLLENFHLESEKEIILEYLDFLKCEGYGFFTNKKIAHFYNELNKEFDIPFKISNILIDIEDIVSSYLDKILHEVNLLNIRSIEIRFFNDQVNLNDLYFIHNLISKTNIGFVSIIVPVNNFLNIDLNNCHFFRFSQIVFYNCESESIEEKLGTLFFFSNKKNITEKSCGIVDTKYFSVNLELYTESLNHNSCLHKKIAIDKEGNIKNCPSMPQSFGNIKDTTLEEALAHKDFKKYWNITKDQIETCKDCEFRYVCTDCRAYIENPENQYSKPLKCGYNPYTNEWEEWSTNPLKQNAIDFYGMRELVDNKILK